MKRHLVICLTAAFVCCSAANSLASDFASVGVVLKAPAGPLKLGDMPTFTAIVTNLSQGPLEGLVAYLSLVSLEPGNEHPVDLEDWSAKKAIRIDNLSPGEAFPQDWQIRLIQSGRFGIAATVIDPKEHQPVVSDLVTFDVQAKQTLSAERIVPVAIGEPVLLVAILILARWFHHRRRQDPSKPAAG